MVSKYLELRGCGISNAVQEHFWCEKKHEAFYPKLAKTWNIWYNLLKYRIAISISYVIEGVGEPSSSLS